MKKSILLTAALVLSSPAWILAAPVLRVGPVTASELSVQFTDDSKHAVSTLQFDVVLPKGVSASGVTTGAAATAASKNATGAPVRDKFRVIVFGINQTEIKSGELVKVNLRADKSSTPEASAFKLTNVIYSDAKGNMISAR